MFVPSNSTNTLEDSIVMARATRTALVIIVLCIACAGSARAQVSVEVQLHGAPLISSLFTQLSPSGDYRFENLSRAILALDARTGEHIYTISHPDRDCLTFNASLLRLQSPSMMMRGRLHMEIDRFNRSASVGTIYFDERSGEVSLRHNVDPGQVGIRAIAEVARRFGHVVAIERRNLAGLTSM
jgi:hypothetical protein